jgi:hypothetical protein
MRARNLTVAVIGIAVGIGAAMGALYFRTVEVEDARRSGFSIGHQVWKGEITVTGDVTILGSLAIEPGTTVRFAVGDDRGKGDEVPADGFNDLDPTRLLAYGRTHSNILVIGKVTAVGTEDRPITLTSASERPTFADWEAFLWTGNGSRLEGMVVEYTRNGLNPVGDQPDTVIGGNTLRHCLWGCISAGHSPVQIIENHASDCGHEGIDVQGADMVIRGNLIEDCNGGIVILGGSPIVENNTMRRTGGGIHVAPGATPTMAGNVHEPAPPDSALEWRYGTFRYKMYAGPAVDR